MKPNKSNPGQRNAASFRDPSGFIFTRGGTIFRQINDFYRDNYDLLIKSGLYKHLISDHSLISHRERNPEKNNSPQAYKILQPQLIPFISYPYEWSFSQFRDAALLTLKIQKEALSYNMSLKDCSAYNIQFKDGHPIFIDTLSFEKYISDQPWVAYRQFCQHFLAPLALMSIVDISLNQLLRTNIDGIPLDLASTLLPPKTFLSPSLLIHIHLHARLQQSYGNKRIAINKKYKFKRHSFIALINSLEKAIKKLNWAGASTEWGNYYSATNYSNSALQKKKDLISIFIDRVDPKTVWDIGGNMGPFSRIASHKDIFTVSLDIDPVAIEKNYRESVKERKGNILPLLFDLTNPSPDLGWANQERLSLINRGPADAILALALIHHLAISNNIPLNMVASFFHKIGKNLIIEWVPKSDSNVKKLLATREDVFPDYTQKNFEEAFHPYFKVIQKKSVIGSQRTLYLMEKKSI